MAGIDALFWAGAVLLGIIAIYVALPIIMMAIGLIIAAIIIPVIVIEDAVRSARRWVERRLDGRK